MKYLNEESARVNSEIKESSQILSAKMDNILLKRG